MPYKKKSWTEKLHDTKDFPRIEKITEKMSKRWGATGTVVIPSPLEVNELMRKIPKGKLTTINQIRKYLAEKHDATICCPLTSGMFARIAAEAAEEQKQQGKKDTTPYWRTLKEHGVINPKYPGGTENKKQRLEQEGHTIFQKGKKYFVKDYNEALAKL
ncbi:MAG: MGMT family protein [Candidatus Bathyarchaeota archaeon]|nr:MGMT family protein [Candidatus Bathyarchaeota archaeon]